MRNVPLRKAPRYSLLLRAYYVLGTTPCAEATSVNIIGQNLVVQWLAQSNSLNNYYVLTMYFVKLSSRNTKIKEALSLSSRSL